MGVKEYLDSLQRKFRREQKNPASDAQLLTPAQHFLQWQFSVTTVYSIFSPNGFCKGLTTKLCHKGQNYWPWGCVKTGGNESFAWQVWGQRLTKELSYTGGEAGRQSWLAGGRRTLLPPTTLQREEALKTLIPTPRSNMIRTADATGPMFFAF